jgi:AraC-like DNA-binding protein
VIEHIQSHPADHLSLKTAAHITGRSPSTVSRLFKKATGRSFKQYQVWFRLKQACSLLISTPNQPISEIAEAVGFEDSLYFSRLFNRHLGLTPSDYRKSKGLNSPSGAGKCRE